MSKNFRQTLKKQLEDTEFKQEWDKTELEYQIIKTMLTENKNIEK